MARAESKSPSGFARIRVEIGALLGFDVENLNFLQRLRLDRAVSLRLELDRYQDMQLRGEAIDVTRMSSAAEQLENLLPKDEAVREDRLALLTDDEVALLNHLMARLDGLATPDDAPPSAFKVEFTPAPSPFDQAGQPDRTGNEALAAAKWQAEQDAAAITALKARVAELEVQIVAASMPETEAESRLLKLLNDNEVTHERAGNDSRRIGLPGFKAEGRAC